MANRGEHMTEIRPGTIKSEPKIRDAGGFNRLSGFKEGKNEYIWISTVEFGSNIVESIPVIDRNNVYCTILIWFMLSCALRAHVKQLKIEIFP